MLVIAVAAFDMVLNPRRVLCLFTEIKVNNAGQDLRSPISIKSFDGHFKNWQHDAADYVAYAFCFNVNTSTHYTRSLILPLVVVVVVVYL